MGERVIFAILGIEQTKDEEAIRTAYRTLLIQTNPEDDPEGFKRLREAYEKAVEYARRAEPQETQAKEDSSPVGKWMHQVEEVYASLSRRLDEKEWKRLVHDDICMDLEQGDEAKQRLFVFLANHYRLTSKIYQILDEAFHIREDEQTFREHLPGEFVDYLLNRIADDTGDMDFDFSDFKGADDADYDAFLNYYNNLTVETQNQNGTEASQIIRAMEELGIEHPLLDLEKARTAQLLGDNETALHIIRPLLEAYPHMLRIQVMGGEVLYLCGLHEEANQLFLAYEENGYYIVEKYLCLYAEEKGNLPEAIRHCCRALQYAEDSELMEKRERLDDRLIEQCELKAVNGSLTDEEASCLIGAYSRREKPEKGVDFLEKYPEYAGRMERLHEYLSILYFQLKRYEDGIAECALWRKSLVEGEKQEKETNSWIHEGESWFALGRNGKKGAYAMALKAFEAAFRLAPENLHIHQKILDVTICMEQYEKAVALADEIIAINNQWFPAFVQKQKACFELHRAQEVIDCFYDAKRIYPGFSGIYEKAAEVFLLYRQCGDADNILKQAQEANVVSPLLDILTLRSMRIKEWELREEQRKRGERPSNPGKELKDLAYRLKEKFKKEPADAETMGRLFEELGRVESDMKDFRQAARYFRKAIAYHDRPFYHYLLANALFDGNNEEQALKEYHIYEEANGPDEGLYINMARCYRSNGNRKKAIVYFKKALKVNRANDEANAAISELYYRMLLDSGNKHYGRRALTYASSQLELIPEDGYYLRERGLIYLRMKCYQEAMADFNHSLEVEKSPYGFNMKGRAHFYMGQYEEALAAYRKAIEHMEKDNRFTAPYSNILECLIRMGRDDEVEKWFQSCVSFFPAERDKEVFRSSMSWWYGIRGRFDEKKSILKILRKVDSITERKFDIEMLRIDELTQKVTGRTLVERGKELVERYNDAEVWEELSRIYLFEMDDRKNALKAALTSLKKSEERGTVWENRNILLHIIWCYDLLGERENAVAYRERFFQELKSKYRYNPKQSVLEQYMDDVDDDVDHILDLTICYLWTGELDKAEEYFSMLKEGQMCRSCKQTVCHDIMAMQGRIYEAKGNIPAAIECYERTLKVCATHRECIYRIKLLKGNKGKKKLFKLFWRGMVLL